MSKAGKWNKSWRVIVFFGIVTVFFSLLIAATIPKYKSPSTAAEIAQTDLSQDYICLNGDSGEVYPGRLYTPADFAKGVPEPGDPQAKYQTCRIVLSLRPGVTYGVTGQTATYAQRVYVNGELLHQIGKISDTPEGFTPKTDFYTIYFTPQQAETEIIVQNAWHNHSHGAFHKIFLAEQQVITRTNRAQTLCDGLVAGTLLSMGIFFLGMFLFNLSNRGMLWFSLSNLCAAVHYLIYESKQIMTFFPNLNWYLGHKIELLTNIYYFVFMALFAFAVLRYRPPRWFSRLSHGLVGAMTVFYILAPSTLYSRFTIPIGGTIMLYELLTVLVLLGHAAKHKEARHPDHMIVFLSPLLTLFVYLVESITYFSHIFYLRAYFMILMAFCNALVLTIGHARTERRLSEVQRRELEIAEENAMLEKMNSLKNDFMRNLAHEMKTPLTVMSGYAQLTGRQIQKNAVNEETAANLETIAREAGRLSDMVTRLLDVTYRGAEETAAFSAQELLDDAAAVCRPVLLKNGNRLAIQCRTRRQIRGSKEALLQVLINLSINASKHTSDGLVAFGVGESGERGMAVFTVSDNGGGIREEDLPHIFERGYSTDGGNGLGLTICREIIESMGGSIAVEKTGKTGTTIRFTVPMEQEAQP